MSPKIRPTCPVCGYLAQSRRDKYGVYHKCCGLIGRDFKPLVDTETRQLRVKLHNIFDQLWKPPSPPMSRHNAYVLLANQLGLNRASCHIGDMPKDTLKKAIPIATRLVEKYRDNQ